MSDPVSNADVEDVLSSIRRLVSSDSSSDDGATEEGEDTCEGRPSASDSDDDKKTKPADALILTSALRVNQPVEEPKPEFRHTEMSNFRSVLTTDDAEQSEGALTNRSDWRSPVDDEYYEDEEQPPETPVIDFVRHNRRAEVTKVTEFADEQTSWQPQMDEVDEKTQPVDAQAKTVEDEGQLQQRVDDEDNEPEAHPDEALELEAEASLESWTVPPSDTSVDDEDFDSEEVQTDVFEQETIFATAAAASVGETSIDDAEPAEKVDLGDLDDGTIDEDVLRDLVAEIVRQELTGELGERITRNVRKLVRREIHRALVTREFE
ncbi:hypothetical protein [Litoreibacter arenae]|uniref:Uncharacterized protein n=1 Tax=Litoreibacter arenae DSM 19593 TaxID=1123360 RepID=S9QH71_9RHOB|nr:hypothetical protein [Litoreibacter arenae]EPX80816.1 hypothetical protein thalar_01037 [Litoreibacter arenae DSM 19593]